MRPWLVSRGGLWTSDTFQNEGAVPACPAHQVDEVLMVTQTLVEMPVLGRTVLYPSWFQAEKRGWVLLHSEGEWYFDLLFYKDDAVWNHPTLQLGLGMWESESSARAWGGWPEVNNSLLLKKVGVALLPLCVCVHRHNDYNHCSPVQWGASFCSPRSGCSGMAWVWC